MAIAGMARSYRWIALVGGNRGHGALLRGYCFGRWRSRAWCAPTGVLLWLMAIAGMARSYGGSCLGFLCVCAFSAVVVFKAHNVVFAEVIAALHFYDVGGLVERIGNSVHVANGYVG
jgi:hypothetical protein